MPNSLSLSLTESALFLRAVHIAHHTRAPSDNAPPSILRALLILSLAKPTRISSIKVELVGQSITIWTEGQSTRYPAELQEKNKIFSATRTFFQAPRTTTGRRALSLDPGLSYYADQDERSNRHRRASLSPACERQFDPVDTPRGREIGRRRIGVDEHDPREVSPLPPDPPSPVSDSTSPRNSPQPPYLSPADERLRVSDDNLLEHPRSQSHGRTSARFSLATMSSSILQAVRGVSGPSKECKGDDHSHHPLGSLKHLGELVGLDGNEHGSDEFGDGWQEFNKGTYSFPISFAIPSHMPPTMQCDYGSVAWHLKATVHRPGPFTSKLSASREVILVASPNEDDREDIDSVTIERHWEDQMQYMLTVSGRVFPIGGTVPITLTLLPMAKVKVFELSIQLEERVDYFFSFSPTACRKDPKRRFELFSLKSTDENIPLLPLPEMVTSVEGHPLYPLLKDNDDTSKFLANLMGPGPWTFQLSLTVPNKCGALHFSNKNKRAPIEVSHSLKIVFRAQRGDDQHIDPQSGKPKQFDIMLRMPVHVLSPLSNAEHTALPRYSESPDVPSPSFTPVAPCASFEDHGQYVPTVPRCLVPPGASAPPASCEERTSSEVGMFYERNIMFERLITGQQREDGVVPPAYCAAA